MTDEPPQAEEPLRTPRWRSYLRDEPLGSGLAIALIVCFIAQALAGRGPDPWGVSARALQEGRSYTLLTHMFVHAGVVHILFNLSALISLAPSVTTRLSPSPLKPIVFLGLYLICGLAGAAVFVGLNPQGVAPAVGASGAICGLWGASARLGPFPGRLTPLFSRPMFRQVQAFTVMNLALIAIVWMLSGGPGGAAAGGIAWEAHLGGFVAGLVLAPSAVRLVGGEVR